MASEQLYTDLASQLQDIAIRVERLRLIYNGVQMNDGPGTASDQMVRLLDDIRAVRDRIDSL